MKTKFLLGWRWMLAVTSTIVLLGCVDRTPKSSAQPVTTEVIAQNVSATVETDTPPTRAIIPPANLSPGVVEVVKLAESGVGEEVLTAYVEKSSQSFNPSVDEIVYLKDIGIPESVVAAMVRHETVTGKPSSPDLAENTPAPQGNVTAPGPINSGTASNPVDYSNAIATTPPPQEVNVNYFESALSPYGSWVEVADYGRCWQPTVVVINRSWRPYGDRGRWIYTSSGWYWQSDYSWGWAPFHYGRWHCDSRIGWVWVPGSTWGPAWVSWRYTDDYCGWAPLPPTAYYVSGFGFRFHNAHVGINFDFGLPSTCYTFIPTVRFCDRSPSHYYVSGSHSTTIYNNSVVINNYIRGNNNTIINEGVGRDRIAKVTRKPIQTVPLRELPETVNPIGRVDRLEGNHLTVFRPKISPGRTAVAATTRDSVTPTRVRSSLANTPTPSAVQNPAISTTSGEPTRTVTRTVSPGGITRHSPSNVEQASSAASPNTTIKPTETPTRTIITTRPNTGSSTVRNLPAQNSTPERVYNFGSNGASPAQTEPPRSIHRNTPSIVAPTPAPHETRTVAPTVIRTEPNRERTERPQPVPRANLQQPSVRSFGASQGSVRSIAPSAQSAPAQNFNSPSQSHGVSRVERSVPQASQPSRATPQPSVRQSAPRPSAPASRERTEKPAAQNGRSDRSRS